MQFSLFDHGAPHQEASTLVAFAQNRLDRQSENRSESCLADAMAEPTTRFFAISAGHLVMRSDDGLPDGLMTRAEIDALRPDFDNAILLGWADSAQAQIAVSVKTAPDDLPPGLNAIDTRSVYRQGLLTPQTLGAYAQGVSLVSWALSNRHCGRCGQLTRAEAGGYRRKCPDCSVAHFPRTDPVAIMLAIDEASDRCLMGRSPHFSPGMYSCLAGFVEPGETLEDAVRRETAEESGIRIGRVRYHASQPWPMPHSLMIGCYAEALSFEIERDSHELEDCRWFSREEAAAMLAFNREVNKQPANDAAAAQNAPNSTPPLDAIASRLIQDWLEWPR